MEKFTREDTYRRTAQITYPHPNRESSIYLPSSKCISVSDPHPKKVKKEIKESSPVEKSAKVIAQGYVYLFTH